MKTGHIKQDKEELYFNLTEEMKTAAANEDLDAFLLLSRKREELINEKEENGKQT